MSTTTKKNPHRHLTIENASKLGTLKTPKKRGPASEEQLLMLWKLLAANLLERMNDKTNRPSAAVLAQVRGFVRDYQYLIEGDLRRSARAKLTDLTNLPVFPVEDDDEDGAVH
jgi:hypothetical protein